MKNSFLAFPYIFLAILSFLTWFSVTISPSVHWIFAFIPLLIPVILLLNIGFLILWITRQRWFLMVLALVVLISGYPFITRTIAFNSPVSTDSTDISFLSYNVRVFNNYAHLKDRGRASEGILEFASDHHADIKCFQEFYNNPGDDSFQTVKRIKKRNPYYYFKPSHIVYGQSFGLAIFSKYPIVKKGEVEFSHRTLNQAIYADIKVRNDTIRVFNMHLQSMSIDENRLPAFTDDSESKNRARQLFQKIKRGSELRSLQIKALISEIEKSPYKVILAGDLNDTPYSYSYELLREELNNAFEEKGSGFGFTYNGKLFFLRIDNIFYDKKLNLNNFKIRRDVPYSDHFPLEAIVEF